ncbi:MAG TPA: hypothetical protein P5558_21250 [Geminicoccaceae bacterium]|nr:hypothetical protein [Geminicoccaceae bacterium]
MPHESVAQYDSRLRGHSLLAFARQALKPGTRGQLARRLRTRLWADISAIGFRRDLHVAFTAPDARIPLEIRQLTAADAPAILGDDDPTLDVLERWERATRLRLWTNGLGRCFAAIAPDGRPCFVQWIFLPVDNAGLRAYSGDTFPELAPGEALVEGAFTPAAFRGKGVMPAAMARIVLEAGKLGARYVHTFVEVDNMPSLKGCIRAGFPAYQWREQHWRLMRRRHEFGPLPADFATRFAAIYR